ncbi:MAG: ATP-binding protein [Planctomycetota bacterium]
MLPPILKDKVDDILLGIMASLNAGLSVVDKDLNIIWANENLRRMLHTKQNVVGKRCYEVYGCACKDASHCSSISGLSNGERNVSDIQFISEKGGRKYIKNISIPVNDEKGAVGYFLKLSLDVTEKEEKISQLSLLRKFADMMQGTLHIDRLLHLILTCVTAGTALGFNRARLFLVDKKRNVVYGKMAVGPSSYEEAVKVWSEITSKYGSLEDLIDASENRYQEDTPLHKTTRLMVYSLADESEPIVSGVKNKKIIWGRNAYHDPTMSRNFVNMIGADEFVCVPLIAREEAIGAICVDNLYSKKPITDDQVQMLVTVASRAALAIENAEAYKSLEEKIKQLEEAQERLIRSERLAVIGNMAAYIAHEIRNPLVTIGGFARTISRISRQDNHVRKSTEIIVEEVNRLEKILANITDFGKPLKPVKGVFQVNDLLENTCSLMGPYFKNSNIQLIKKFNESAPPVTMDSTQMKQVFVNLMKNAVESMLDGGTLILETTSDDKYVRINVTDTCKGIPAETIQRVFEPFFTTKADGTGIGLAVSKKIVDEHGGSILVKSSGHSGTTFSVYLPIKTE